MPEELRLDRVTKRYGEKTIVSELSLAVETGAIAGLVGPNGCGKTTTLSMIAGIKTADEGKVLISGHDVAAAPVRAKLNLALVPDEPSGFEQLTVLEYLDLYRSLHKQPRDRYDERARLVLEAFGLTKYRNSGLGELSHGTRRKVVTTAACAVGAPLLMIDEPTVGLDPESVVVLRSLVRHARRSGSAVLLATQDLAFAERVCDHLFLIDEGRLLASGPPSRLLELYEVSSVEEAFLSATGIGRRIDDFEHGLEALSR